jgi:hypothetical protein
MISRLLDSLCSCRLVFIMVLVIRRQLCCVTREAAPVGYDPHHASSHNIGVVGLFACFFRLVVNYWGRMKVSIWEGNGNWRARGDVEGESTRWDDVRRCVRNG